jgi:hypothetical protein
MPAPKNNQNATRHGLRSELNRLPPGCGRVQKQRDELRRFLEAAVLERTESIDVYAATTIQTACRWAAHAALAARWLRAECGSMTPEQRLAYSREVCRASSERDRCIRDLGLDKQPDPFAGLYAPWPTPVEPPESPPDSLGPRRDSQAATSHLGAAGSGNATGEVLDGSETMPPEGSDDGR